MKILIFLFQQSIRASDEFTINFASIARLSIGGGEGWRDGQDERARHRRLSGQLKPPGLVNQQTKVRPNIIFDVHVKNVLLILLFTFCIIKIVQNNETNTIPSFCSMSAVYSNPVNRAKITKNHEKKEKKNLPKSGSFTVYHLVD